MTFVGETQTEPAYCCAAAHLMTEVDIVQEGDSVAVSLQSEADLKIPQVKGQLLLEPAHRRAGPEAEQ